MNDRPVAYIAGPMKGRDKLNKPAFRAAEYYVASLGYRTVIPHDIAVRDHPGPCPDGYDAAQSDHSGWCYLRSDIAVMAACDVVVLLAGWTDSKGASIEHEIATRLEIPCFPLEQLPAAAELFTAAPAAEPDEPDPWAPGTDITDRLEGFPRVWLRDRMGGIFKPHGKHRWTRWCVNKNDWGSKGWWRTDDFEDLAPITVATKADLDAAGIPTEERP